MWSVKAFNAAAVHIVYLLIHFPNIYDIFVVQSSIRRGCACMTQKKSASALYLSMNMICCLLPLEVVIRQRIRMKYGKRINPMVQPASWHHIALCWLLLQSTKFASLPFVLNTLLMSCHTRVKMLYPFICIYRISAFLRTLSIQKVTGYKPCCQWMKCLLGCMLPLDYLIRQPCCFRFSKNEVVLNRFIKKCQMYPILM